MFRVRNCDIGISALSDRNPVYLSLNLNGKIKSTLWRLNTNILNDKEITNKLIFKNNDNDAVSPIILWDALKAVLPRKIIAISSNVKKLKKLKLLDLEIKLKELQKEHSSSLQDSVKVKMFEVKEIK